MINVKSYTKSKIKKETNHMVKMCRVMNGVEGGVGVSLF